MTVYGDGSQTRSVQYVEDLIEGAFRLMRSSEARPVNVGNPVEHTVGEIAELVIELSGGEGRIIYEPLPEDDPKRRCPDISRARESLGWEPRVSAREGLKRTIDWFAQLSNDVENIALEVPPLVAGSGQVGEGNLALPDEGGARTSITGCSRKSLRCSCYEQTFPGCWVPHFIRMPTGRPRVCSAERHGRRTATNDIASLMLEQSLNMVRTQAAALIWI